MKDFFEKVEQIRNKECAEIWLCNETFNLLSYDGNITLKPGQPTFCYSAVSEDGILDMVLSFKSGLYGNAGEFISTVQVLSVTWTDEETVSYDFPDKGFHPIII